MYVTGILNCKKNKIVIKLQIMSKNDYQTKFSFFLQRNKNSDLHCGYSFKSPPRSEYNEYPRQMFDGETSQISINYLRKYFLSGAMLYIHLVVFIFIVSEYCIHFSSRSALLIAKLSLRRMDTLARE